MGVYLSLGFVEKAKIETFIVGKLPSLKVYEANLAAVENNNYYYNKTNYGVQFYNGGYIFSELRSDSGEYYSFSLDCYFWEMAYLHNDVIQRQWIRKPGSYDDLTIFLFEMDVMENAFKNVMEYAKEAKCDFADEERYNSDMVLLETFYENMIKNKDKGLLVSCMVG